jgi:phosphate transport system permease protein
VNVKAKDKIATIILYAISTFIVALLVGLIGFILYKGLSTITPAFLYGNPKFGEAGGGIGPQLFNSFYLLVISLVITLPLGVGAGIYLSQYAKQGPLLNIIRLSIETMASLPSIVVGLFGLLVFVVMWKMGYSLLAGALSITVLNLPSMARVSENAITAASGTIASELSFHIFIARVSPDLNKLNADCFPKRLTFLKSSAFALIPAV